MRSMSEGRISCEGLPGPTPACDFGLRAGSVPWAGRRRSVKARLLRPRAIALPPFQLVSERSLPGQGVAGVRREPLRAFAPQGLTERSSCARAFTARCSPPKGR
jgi:hypothetical protein